MQTATEEGLGFNSSVQGVPVARSIFVKHDGSGDFTSIQRAIDSVPSRNNQWIRIHVSRGSYGEKVLIPEDKPFIFLEGEGAQTTIIYWGDASDTRKSPTFEVRADNFVAKYITFKQNTFNRPLNFDLDEIKQAVAAMVSGDKISFYGCAFLGLQDTLWDNTGRHYFKQCYIEGAVDFIFGAAQSTYEHSIALENPLPHSCFVSRRPVALSEFTAQHHRQQTLSLFYVFSGFDCDDDDMVTAYELYLALHWLGFEAAADELETNNPSEGKCGREGRREMGRKMGRKEGYGARREGRREMEKEGRRETGGMENAGGREIRREMEKENGEEEGKWGSERGKEGNGEGGKQEAGKMREAGKSRGKEGNGEGKWGGRRKMGLGGREGRREMGKEERRETGGRERVSARGLTGFHGSTGQFKWFKRFYAKIKNLKSAIVDDDEVAAELDFLEAFKGGNLNRVELMICSAYNNRDRFRCPISHYMVAGGSISGKPLIEKSDSIKNTTIITIFFRTGNTWALMISDLHLAHLQSSHRKIQPPTVRSGSFQNRQPVEGYAVLISGDHVIAIVIEAPEDMEQRQSLLAPNSPSAENFSRCTLKVTANSEIPWGGGAITAQGRESPSDPNGFVFLFPAVVGTGPVYLGRAWRAASRVVFYNAALYIDVVPAGWDAWSFAGHTENIVFAEVRCRGKGSNMSKRVKWEKQLSLKDLTHLITLRSYINPDGWLQRQP
ncbi:hypothetical protein ACLOJK_026550 [Asimina triloba]